VQRSLHSKQYAVFLSQLRAARAAAAVTQVELAARLAVDQAVISKSERGARRLDVVELLEWLNALGVEPAQFVSSVAAEVGRHTSRARQARHMIRRKAPTQ
jgi:transcriptional regulator with XRE-family HTH domain